MEKHEYVRKGKNYICAYCHKLFGNYLGCAVHIGKIHPHCSRVGRNSIGLGSLD